MMSSQTEIFRNKIEPVANEESDMNDVLNSGNFQVIYPAYLEEILTEINIVSVFNQIQIVLAALGFVDTFLLSFHSLLSCLHFQSRCGVA